MKHIIRTAVGALGFEIRRKPRVEIRDQALYDPLFDPSLAPGPFAGLYETARPFTLVSRASAYVLYTLASQSLQLGAELWECGVYRGGTAMMLAGLSAGTDVRLRLFDTFEGMPATDAGRDLHNRGDFADTSLEAVKGRVGSRAAFHQGLIPATFAGLEGSRIAFAHVDVDIYRSVLDCCAFIYPRLVAGGFLLFDDYGFPTCPGARQAVDEYFDGRPDRPLVLPTGQAVVFRSSGS